MQEVVEQRKRDLARQKEEKEEQERLEKLEEDRVKVREEIKLRKRKAAQNVPQKSDEELASYSVSAVKDGMTDDDSLRRNKPISGGLWTDEDLVELVRLVKKYPGGTTNRWEVIAEMMNRSVYDVTHMAAKLKETAYKVPGQTDSPAEQILQEANKNKVKTRKVPDNAQADSVWTQEQQKALEAAIIKHPKTAIGDRWQKIASSVPGKTKEECLARYKYLVELIKKQKQATETPEEKPDKEPEIDSTENVGQVEEVSEKPDTDVISKKKSEKKSKKMQKERKNSAQDEDLEIPEKEEVTKSSTMSGGKAKNKRKARKKDFEISYDDYQDSDADDDDY